MLAMSIHSLGIAYRKSSVLANRQLRTMPEDSFGTWTIDSLKTYTESRDFANTLEIYWQCLYKDFEYYLRTIFCLCQ